MMVGILLALQVNNWNDARRNEQKEREILQQFKSELDQDVLILDEIMTDNNFVIRACNELIIHLEGDLPYHDSLAIYFDGWSRPGVLEFNTSTFQNMITTGPEHISSAELRNQLLKHYNY